MIGISSKSVVAKYVRVRYERLFLWKIGATLWCLQSRIHTYANLLSTKYLIIRIQYVRSSIYE